MTWHMDWVGSPYRAGGRGPEAFDCWGLVRAVYARHLDIVMPSHGDISATDLMRLARAIGGAQSGWPWVPVAVPAAFDVVVMARPGGRAAVHLGVIAAPGLLLHTERATGAVLVPLDHCTIRHRILGFRRHVSR